MEHLMTAGAADLRDAENMALCAIRYAIGRRSYIVVDGWRWAREWGAKSEWVRDVIRRDLREARGRPGALGDHHDEEGWLSVLADLDAMAGGAPPVQHSAGTPLRGGGAAIEQQAAAWRETAPYLDRLQAVGRRLGWPLGRLLIASAVEQLERDHPAPIMCGGCGATADKDRCLGCLHDFGTPESEWVRKLAKDMLDG